MYRFDIFLVAVVACFMRNVAHSSIETAESVFWAARTEFLTQFDVGYSLDSVGLEDHNSSYSLDGTIRQAIYTNFTTSDSPEYDFAVVGFAANQCIVQSAYAFKFQLQGDSCDLTYIQYFDDFECTKLASTQPLLKSVDTASKIQCTTRTAPLHDPRYVVTAMFHEGAERDGAVMQYVAYPLLSCLTLETQSMRFSCRGRGGTVAETFDNFNCSGSPSNVDYPSFNLNLPLYDIHQPRGGSVENDDAPRAQLFGAMRCHSARTT